jgi:hypothetical protein
MSEAGDHLREANDRLTQVNVDLELARLAASDDEAEMIEKVEELVVDLKPTLYEIGLKADEADTEGSNA